MVVIYRKPVVYVNRTSVNAMDYFFGMHDSNVRLRQARIKAGFKSARSASQRHNWKESTYASHENGQSRVPVDDAETYAKAFGVTAGWILTGDGDQQSQKSYSLQPRIVPLSRLRSQDVSPLSDVNLQDRQQLTGANDLPIYPSADAGDGAIIIDTAPIDQVPRPVGLEHEKDAFGVLITGECMVPEFNPGEYAFIHPRKPPMRGRACLLMTDGADGKWLGSLKSFIRGNEREWIVEQHNPKKGQTKELKFSKEKWPKCLRVVGKYEGR